MHANPHKSKRKIALLSRLLQVHDVTVLQETHGDGGDAAALERIFPHFVCYSSASENSYGGGVMTFINPDFVKRFTKIEHFPLIPGRVQAIRLHIDEVFAIEFVNVHIPLPRHGGGQG